MLDVNRSGTLEVAELARVLRDFHINVESKSVTRLAEHCQAANPDGSVDYQRFVQAFGDSFEGAAQDSKVWKTVTPKLQARTPAEMDLTTAEITLVNKLVGMHSELRGAFKHIDWD